MRCSRSATSKTGSFLKGIEEMAVAVHLVGDGGPGGDTEMNEE